MPRRRREVSFFSIAFLAVMACGFGAVILFFMITNVDMTMRQERLLEEHTSQVSRLELQVLTSRKNLLQNRQELAELLQQWAVLRGMKDELITEIDVTVDRVTATTDESREREAAIERLRADLDSLRTETERLAAASITPTQAGDRIRAFTGEGNRQYLTGLRMGGQRVLILVNVSTSMLDRTLVNVLRRRNMPEEQQRRAPKWRQTVGTVDWLTTQIQPNTQVQVVAFNDEAWSLIEESDGNWVTVTDGSQLEAAVEALRRITPSGGTNLHAAFNAARELNPRPDNIFLIVDKLPTRGEVNPTRDGVTGRERVGHFGRAVRQLPVGVPVNVILLPMEGDPQAPPNYWRLALQTGGSLLAPAEDWP